MVPWNFGIFVGVWRVALFSVAMAGQTPEIVEAARSPFALKRYVNTHEGFDWEPLWKSLPGPKGGFLPLCGRGDCVAETVVIAAPNQVFVMLESRGSALRAYLRYMPAPNATWKCTGVYFPYAKYFDLSHRLAFGGETPFLMITSQGISGSGVSSKLENWFDLTRAEFQPVFGYVVEGHYSRTQPWLVRKVKGSAHFRAKGVIEVDHSLAITLESVDAPSILVTSLKHTYAYRPTASGEFVLNKDNGPPLELFEVGDADVPDALLLRWTGLSPKWLKPQ